MMFVPLQIHNRTLRTSCDSPRWPITFCREFTFDASFVFFYGETREFSLSYVSKYLSRGSNQSRLFEKFFFVVRFFDTNELKKERIFFTTHPFSKIGIVSYSFHDRLMDIE